MFIEHSNLYRMMCKHFSILWLTVFFVTIHLQAQDGFLSTMKASSPNERRDNYLKWIEKENGGSTIKQFKSLEQYNNFVDILGLFISSQYMHEIDSLNLALPPEQKYGRKAYVPYYFAFDLASFDYTAAEISRLQSQGCNIFRDGMVDCDDPPYSYISLLMDCVIEGTVIETKIPDFSFQDGYRKTIKFVINELFKGNNQQGDTITVRLRSGAGENGSYVYIFPDDPNFKVGDRYILYLSQKEYQRSAHSLTNTSERLEIKHPNYACMRWIPLNVSGQIIPDNQNYLTEIRKFCKACR